MRSRVWRDRRPSRDSIGLVSRPSCSERTCASGRRAGTQRNELRSAAKLLLAIRRVALGEPSCRPWVPGLATLARDTKAAMHRRSRLTDLRHQRADQCSRTARGTRNGLRRMPNTGRRCAPPGAATARPTRRRCASAGGSGCRTIRIFANASAPAAANGSAGSATGRSTGSRWSITTRCAAAEWRLRHLQAIRPGAVCRSLPRVRQGARAPLRQMQQRARVLRRQPRASAGGRRVPAGVV